jgi:hypothetical protein
MNINAIVKRGPTSNFKFSESTNFIVFIVPMD